MIALVIPGGYTKYLLLLDATVINSFKRHCEYHSIENKREIMINKSKCDNYEDFGQPKPDFL